LEKLIAYVSKLDELDTEGVEPLIYLHPVENATRPDKLEKEFTQEELLRNAPTKEDGYILVPKIIE
ncbi:MAG TPA: Asp-tRNA(Asn)/Glu-tRNA(Gln) amidotransferase subunit GatC, partial [Tissierellaceae bacterium]|nr:Asp-tRNA(Asn)/Glu-tRNA(Gln) amidotransferase subunit GatC [Tissierellaceae bacterium]